MLTDLIVNSDFLEFLYLLLYSCIYLFVSCILASIVSSCVAFYNTGVIKLKDVIGYDYGFNTDYDDKADRVISICGIIFWPLILAAVILMLFVRGLFEIGSKLNGNFLYKNLDKELISSKSYKVKKLLYGKNK